MADLDSFNNRPERVSTNTNRQKDKGLLDLPDDIKVEGDDLYDSLQRNLGVLREGPTNGDLGESKDPNSKNNQEDRPTLEEREQIKPETSKTPERFSSELPSVYDDPEAGERSAEKKGEKSPENNENNERDEASKKQEDSSKPSENKGEEEPSLQTPEDFPENQIAIGRILEVTIKHFEDDLPEPERKLANQILAVSALNLSPEELDGRYPTEEYEAQGKKNPLKIYRQLEAYANALAIKSDVIKKHASGELASNEQIVVTYADKVKKEMAKGKNVDQAFANVVGQKIADELIEALLN